MLGVAALSLWSALLALALDYEAPPQLGTAAGAAGVSAQIGEGLRAITGSRDVALMASLFWAQTFTRGCLMVFSVVVAIDLLSLGEPGVGLLNGAVGAGAVLGSLGAALLVGSRRLGAWLAVAVALWGIPFVLDRRVPERGGGARAARAGRRRQRRRGRRVLHARRPARPRRTARPRLRRDRERRRDLGRHRRARDPADHRPRRITPALAVLGAVCPTLAVLALRAAAHAGPHTRGPHARDRRAAQRADAAGAACGHDRATRAPRGARDIEPGEAVCVQGEPGDAFYVIESGEAEVLGDGKLLARSAPATRSARSR